MCVEECKQSGNNNWSCSKTISLESEAKGIFIDFYSENHAVRIYMYTTIQHTNMSEKEDVPNYFLPLAIERWG